MALAREEQDQLRAELFLACEEFVERRGGFASRDELVNFELRGRRLGLIDRNRGIRNPTEFDETLSIVSAHGSPYEDHVGDDGMFRYSFAPGPLSGGDNRKLYAAYDSKTPLILFERPLSNVYVPVMPVFVVDVDTDARFFIIATSSESRRSFELGEAGWLERRYSTQLVRRRVHQPVFRARVLVAYERACAICHLRHSELLDAAHIIPDSHDLGVATVNNGLALCKLHHAAFDQNMIGVDPSLRVHVNRELLEEVDGPMLKHGIQEMNGILLRPPRQRRLAPSRDSLEHRFQLFLDAHA